jgi:hypothetical protein
MLLSSFGLDRSTEPSIGAITFVMLLLCHLADGVDNGLF